MPLRAVNKEGISCFSFSFKNRASFIASPFNENIFCPFTQSECSIRYRAGYIPHFVRKVSEEISLDHHPESMGHQLLKKLVYDYFSNETLKSSPNLAVTLEVPLPSVGKNGRIADVAIFDRQSNEIKNVVECQLSIITPQELEQRTNDYEQSGIECLWVLGDAAATDSKLVSKCEELFGTAILCHFVQKKTTVKDLFEQLVNDY